MTLWTQFLVVRFTKQEKSKLANITQRIIQNNWRCIFNLSLENNNLIISTDIMHKTIDYDYRNAIYSS